MSALTEEEGEQFKNMLSRIHTVFQAAKDMDVRVMVDAEQTYFQPAISRITMEMMTKYNREKAVVFNTYQCYLKEAYNNLILDLEQSDRFAFISSVRSSSGYHGLLEGSSHFFKFFKFFRFESESESERTQHVLYF